MGHVPTPTPTRGSEDGIAVTQDERSHDSSQGSGKGPRSLPCSLCCVRYQNKRAAPLGRKKRGRSTGGMAVDETGHQRSPHRAGTVRIGSAIEATLCGGEQEPLGRLTLHLYGIRDLGSRDNREPPASDSKEILDSTRRPDSRAWDICPTARLPGSSGLGQLWVWRICVPLMFC